MRNQAEWQTIEDDVLRLVQEIFALLPDRTAEVKMDYGELFSVGLEPTNPEAAAVGVSADHSSDIVYVDFGLARTTWELPYESKNPRDYSKEFLFAELREMFVAVIKANCEEEHKFLRTTGRIFTPNRTYSQTNSPKFRRFRGIKRYQSYCQEAQAIFALHGS